MCGVSGCVCGVSGCVCGVSGCVCGVSGYVWSDGVRGIEPLYIPAF